ncbi:glycosyltransferase family 2 protein [Flavobacterium sp.]|uniref:glycosyltransferase family 2 protein n=1 Tax=Flavobacterium sp. TaxID=239 RepID=UPI00352922A3
MKNEPLVSVICISYNHEKFVEEALNSVLQQSYTNIELIITDDCSTDNSKTVIEKWLLQHPTILFLPNTKNLGNTKTFNNAVKYANGDYIIDLAADDVLKPECVATQMATFLNSKYEKLGIVYSNINIVNENGAFMNTYYTEKDKPESGMIYNMIISRSAKICSVGSMVKKEVFETVGYYNENLAYEDLDLWVRASRVFQFKYIPETLVNKREFSSNLSSYFYKKLNKKTWRLNYSSYLILKNIFVINTTKEEYKLSLNRINELLNVTLKNLNVDISVKLLWLKIKTKAKLL